jgi:peptide/nickel transport system substrate-binding protein
MGSFIERVGGLVGRTLAAVTLAALCASPGRAETVLRVAMTASDIPDYVGQPDQGMEGFRFVGFQLYEGLISWDLSHSDASPTLKGGLATAWHVDDTDKTKWVFDLRQGVKFHDGCPFNAEAAIWNLERLTSDKVPQFNPVNYARARPRTSSIAKFERIDDNTIAIYTKKPESLFPYNIPFVLMISKCAYEKAGNDYKTYAAAPSGTGPYKFDKAAPGERLELVKNADYWDKVRVPKQDRLVLLPMPEATSRAAALLAGQVDFIEAPSPDMIPRLKAGGMNVITGPYPHTWDYILNFQRGPFKDLRVRQAANYAVNRGEMVELLDGIAQPGFGLFLPTVKYHGHPIKYAFNLQKATELLKEANCYPCNITVAISTSGSGQMQPLPMNELVKAQLEAAGFKVKFETMDWSSMVEIFAKGADKYPQFDAINYSLAVLDPLSGFIKHITSTNRTPAGNNWGGYQNPEIDKLADEAQATFDDAKQTDIITKMHEIIVADANRVFIAHDLNPRALSPKLQGFVQAQSYFQDLTPIVVK